MSLARSIAFVFFAAVVAPGIFAQDAGETFAFEAYQVAEGWVKRGSVPSESLPVRTKGVAAVHVTLRLEGQRLAEATAEAEQLPPPADEPESDVMALVRKALNEAMNEAIVAAPTKGGSDVPYVLDLQFAVRLQPVRLSRVSELRGKVSPGLHGLAMSLGGKWAWVFPGTATAANLSLDSQVNRLLTAFDIPVENKLLIGSANGPALYRFDAIHLTRLGGDTAPTRLHRGQELLTTEPLDDQGIALVGEELADYLVRRLRKDGTFWGTYEPTADKYQPEVADATDAAMAVLALSRAARLGGVGQKSREEAARVGLKALLDEIESKDPNKRLNRQVIGVNAAPTAMALLALLETPGGGAYKAEREKLVAALLAMRGKEGWFREVRKEDGPPVALSEQAMIASVFVSLFDQTRDEAALGVARAALKAAWDRIPKDPDPSRAMPWIALAEMRLLALGQPTEDRKKLAALCDSLWARQVRLGDDPDKRPSPDTVGGFADVSGVFPEPDWDTSLMLCGLSVALRDPTIVPADQRPRWLVNSALAARFLQQLTIQRPGTYYLRNPDRAVGGLRLSLFNNRQPLSASASALLAITELRLTLRQLAGEKK